MENRSSQEKKSGEEAPPVVVVDGGSRGTSSHEHEHEPHPPAKDEEDYMTSDTTDTKEPAKAVANGDEDDWVFITGVKLYLCIGVVTMACFIMLLDTSIVATVSKQKALGSSFALQRPKRENSWHVYRS